MHHINQLGEYCKHRQEEMIRQAEKDRLARQAIRGARAAAHPPRADLGFGSQPVQRYTGLGIAIGAALGLMIGLMLLENLVLGGGAGAALGLVAGSVIDLQHKRED